jgi:hypothetical protein
MPTMAEAGAGNSESRAWSGLAAPEHAPATMLESPARAVAIFIVGPE